MARRWRGADAHARDAKACGDGGGGGGGAHGGR
jgi:hypothetical protein